MDEVFDSALQETAQRLLPLAVVDIVGREELTTPPKGPLGSERWSAVIDSVGGPTLHTALATMRALAGEGRTARGVENAPAVYLAARLLSAVTGRGEIRRGDLWKTDVAQEDMVYAFLSPAPMAALWQKLKTEMKPGSLFVSNSFAVPDVDPDEIWELQDARKTKLYLYPVSPAVTPPAQ